MEFIRPLVMPVILVLVFTILWIMGSIKAMDAQIRHAAQPTMRAAYCAQMSVDDVD
jgi:hypothetical protein